MGDFFLEIWGGFAWVANKQYWREETMGDFSRNLEKGLRGFSTSNVGGRKLWGNCSRNLGSVCVDFQKAILAGGNYGGVFLDIARNCLRGLPKSNIGGRKL